MIRCAITDRSLHFARGVDWVQIRDKQLPARELMAAVREAMSRVRTVIVNSRVDVAIAAGAAGAHLPAGSIAPMDWRAITPVGFMIGVSCHTLDEVTRAAREGADYVVFGPVFAPLSKGSVLAHRGLEGLHAAARSVSIPVLALGGITNENAEDCVAAGAAGVAGITLFRT